MSSQLRMLKARDLLSILHQLGFRKIRQRGSHLFFAHPDGRTTLIAIHGGEDIDRGTLRQILREIEMSPDEFLKYL